MKFAVINNSKDVVAVWDDYTSACDYRNETMELPEDQWSVQPIMSITEFMATHTGFRGFTNGRPSVLYLDPKHGTALTYVYLIGSWDDYQAWSGKQYKDYQVTLDTVSKLDTQ